MISGEKSRLVLSKVFMFRSDEEIELFEKMDIERRREGADLGDKRKPRLIEESELPEFLLDTVSNKKQ